MFTKSKTCVRKVLYGILLLGIILATFEASSASAISDTISSIFSAPIDYYGKSIDVLRLFGQQKISETGRNLVNGNGIYHAAGVLVDRNSPSDRLYIYAVDTGNNRILGFNFNCAYGGTCQMDGSKSADIVFGQPDMATASCNGDNNLGFNQSPMASTLCLLGYPLANNTAESWMRVNIDVDSQGNLYIPDVWNNRVLKFNQPFSADRTNGKGDSIADFVWGQDNMTSNGRNRGSNYGDVNSPDNHSLWVSFGGPFFDHVTSRGVSVDNNGNVWVADTFNNRILRFGPNSKNADLVLGQSDFTSSGCVANGPLNRMCTPTLARVHPTTGDLYVLDEYPAPFLARLLVFKPPFTNGMTAYKSIVPKQDGTFTNWDGWDGTGAYQFQSTGFIFNTYKQGEYASGEIWLNEHQANRTLLIDFDGNIVKAIGVQNKYLRGGDSVYHPECGSIYEGNHLWWPGGSIGMDSANNIYLADEFFHTIYRYALPYNTHQVGNVTCLPEANGVLFPKGPNHQSNDRLGESAGLIVFDNQLLVRDEGMRLKVYNDYQSKPFGVDANYVLTGGFQTRNWLGSGIDDSNRLWLSGEHGQIRIYGLPITSSSEAPIADFVKLYWADTGLEVTRPDGSNYVQVGAMAFDSIHHAMYIADVAGTRIFRVKNYNQFTNKLLVDMVIGQRDKTEIRCNQGLSSPNAETLCSASQIKFDKQGNLFVVDNAYECHDNRRIVVFEASDLNNATMLFPRLQASKVFNAPDLNHVGNCAYWTVDQPGSPVSIAFNSKNQMVIGNDGYYGDASERQLKQLWFYSDPLAKQTPDASIDIYLGTPGELAFDGADNLLIQDHTWYKVYMINLSCDPEWLSFLPGAIVPILPPCVKSPDAFNKSSPTNGATNQSTSPTLNWGSSTGATSYEYCYDTTNDNACSSWMSNGSSNSRVLGGLTPVTTYYWHVRAVNAGGVTYANENISSYWSFTTAPNTITISGNAGVADATLSYTDKTSKTATADGSGNYSFAVLYNWSGSVTPSRVGYTFSPVNKSYINVTVNQTAQNYTATLNTYILTVSNAGTGSGTVTSSPVGINCGPTCSASFTTNTVVTLTATPTAGHTFTGWSGACSGIGACTVTVSSAKSVTANFNNPIKLTPILTASGGPFTYDGASHGAIVTGSIPGTVSNVKYNGSATIPTNAGVYTVTANFVPTDTTNYNSLTNATAGSTTINKSSLTVTANNQTTRVGSPDPSFTFGYFGFVNSETANVLTTAPFCAVSSSHAVVGIYDIVCSGGAAINYTFSYVKGTLTIAAVNNVPIFVDVPFSYWANSYIERLNNAGITGGCLFTPLNYCPDNTVTRAQMAVFLLKGMHGPSFIPPSINGSTGFTDVATNHWAVTWIKQLAAESITSGCGNGNYCPEATVTRAQMAIFRSKAKHGSSYSPPTATGVFTDVPVGYWADKWIERLAAEGVTSGCGNGNYCPEDSVTRAQMAVFLVKAFGLP